MPSSRKLFNSAEKATDEDLDGWPKLDLDYAKGYAEQLMARTDPRHEDSGRALAVARRIGAASERRMFGSGE